MWVSKAPEYRKRAVEVRKQAQNLREDWAKKLMLKCAEDWEEMARREDERAKKFANH